MPQTSTPLAGLVGRLAPDFELECTSGSAPSRQVVRLPDYRGRWLILMFYPRDFSLVCPTELSAMSNRYEEFTALGADVLAISTDSIETHERWITTPKAEGGLGPIKFPLASDATGKMARSYNACLDPQGVALRGHFIIDPNSVVQYQVIHNLNVGRRTDEVMRVLSALQTGGLCAENWSPGRETIDTSRLRTGNVISHYRIEKTLGDGGFATVYLAHDSTLERNVALKIIKKTEGWAPSILNEARAAAALNHPNVCTVYGIDESEGTPMIVMEYLVGRPLARLLAAGPTPPEQVTTMARQIAAGMVAAHDAGVIHGDLKPANIFLTDEDRVKILDFGVAARYRLASSSDDTALVAGDRWGTFVGTPSYMSPERAEGRPATTAGDVFSFGLVLYELLTGKRAFDEPNFLVVLNQIRSIEPTAFCDAVGEPFSSLLRRMLVRDAAKRTITMVDVQDRLKQMTVT